jgi:hypothetical protein
MEKEILNITIMAKTENQQKDGKGPGAAYAGQQKNIDQAINERKKSATGKDKLPPDEGGDESYKPDVDVKKSGRTKD